MGKDSRIEWTEATWNPWIGCHKVSPGCKNCYAERLVEGLQGGDFGTLRRTVPSTFDAPRKWKTPLTIFTCSISDFFHPDADRWRPEAWDVIRMSSHHTFQVLTKRPERIPEALPKDWGDGWPNVWLGVSVESQTYDWRIAQLAEVPAKTRFLSCEPLLGPIDLDFDPGCFWLRGIHWVISGGESGPANRVRPADPSWFLDLRDQCQEAGVAFFHKQNGGSRKCKCHQSWGCRVLEGRTWDEFPQEVTER